MATLTITTTGAQDTRIIAAMTDRLQPVDGSGDPRNATAAEVKTWMIDQLRNVVHSYETRLANEAASAGVTPIDPT